MDKFKDGIFFYTSDLICFEYVLIKTEYDKYLKYNPQFKPPKTK